MPDSIKEVSSASTSAVGVRAGARIARTTLTQSEKAALMEIEIALRMRNFDEFQARVGRGEQIGFDEMAGKYFPRETDYQAALDWADSQGLTITRQDGNRLALFARGTVTQMQEAFGVTFAQVASEDGEFTSAVTAPSLPADLAPAILGIDGLQPHLRMHAAGTGPVRAASLTSNSPPYLPRQILKAYGAEGLSVTGSGQTIALVTQLKPATSDLTAFWAAAGVSQSMSNIEFVSLNSASSSAADDGEATLDTEWSSAMAPGAKVRAYITGVLTSIVFDQAYQQIINDLPSQTGMRQVSISYGTLELSRSVAQAQIELQYFSIMAAAGVTVFSASGDGGSNPVYSGSSWSYDATASAQTQTPASNPFVTSVGGTTLWLDTTTGAVSSEASWSRSGGGASIFHSRPSWQTGAGVTDGTMRLVPDLAAPADSRTGAFVVFEGEQTAFSGTSWSSPVWAGFCALINQARTNAGRQPIGLLNSKIYRMIGTANFRDITGGSNGAYNAGTGYDLCTGVGAPDLTTLVQTLANLPAVATHPKDQAVQSGQSATFAVTADGAATLSYQWRRKAAGGSTWSSLTNGDTYIGATTASLTAKAATAAMSGDQFACIVSNSAGSDESAAATLTVNVPMQFTTFAGSAGIDGSTDGTGTAARFYYPRGAAVDGSGNVYIADTYNHTIRKITAAGVVTTLAGSAGSSGSTDGTGSSARFYRPEGVAVDASGNVYVADTYNQTIRKVTATGVVTTLAGSAGTGGSTDGTGSSARFYLPMGVAVDSSGNVFVADYLYATIRKVTGEGVVTTYTGKAGYLGSTDGILANARFYGPTAIAADGAGNLYVADGDYYTIRKISTSGLVTTLAGSPNDAGNADGTGSGARFERPLGIAADNRGNVYVTDGYSYTVKRIAPSGCVGTLAGLADTPGVADGIGATARFYAPWGIAVDSAGCLYVADSANSTIRKGTPDTTTAFSPQITCQPNGLSVTMGQNATFTVAATGNPAPSYQWQRLAGGATSWTSLSDDTTYSGTSAATLTVTAATLAMGGDQFHCVVSNTSGSVTSSSANLTVNSAIVTKTIAGLAATSGSVDGSGDNARFTTPWGIAVDSSGNLYVADYGNHTIRKIASSGVVSTFAGSAGLSGSTDGTSSTARFYAPTGVAVDGSGNVYVADTYNYTIRKITSAAVVTTFAGSARTSGTTDGTGTAARFNLPRGIAVDSSGNVYVADSSSHTIRKITAAGVVSTFAGKAGTTGTADGAGTSARFRYPYGIAVDSSGNLYVADTMNHTIRKITPAGVVSTLAGSAGISGSNDGSGTDARFSQPLAIAVDSSGNVYVADTNNYTIRKITPAGVVSTLAGSTGDYGTIDGTGDGARFYSPRGIAVDSSGNVYLADGTSQTIREVLAPARVSPQIDKQPQSLSVLVGASATFSVTASGMPSPSYQWLKDGTAISGATSSGFSIASAQASDAGSYSVKVTNSAGSVTSGSASLSISTARISNLSVRTTLSSGQTLTVGFVTSGAKQLLVRAVGPSLYTVFGVTSYVTDPKLVLANGSGTPVAQNDDWNPSLSATFTSLGAFGLDAGGKDAALLYSVSGPHTAAVNGVGSGMMLVEVYDAESSSAGRLTNVSARNQVGTGDNVLVAGFVISGTAGKTLLIRGIGPALYDLWSVSGVLADPKLTLYKQDGTKVAENDDWDPGLSTTFATVGAYAFKTGSKDAALLVTLAPGVYTVQVSGVGETTGDGVVEVYEVP